MEDILTKADAWWGEMANHAHSVDLSKTCDAPCNSAFSSNCVALCSLGMESPFPEGSDLDIDWQDMLYFYRKWRDYQGSAGCAYKKRFVKFGVKLIAAHPQSPFFENGEVSYEAVKETVNRVAEAEDKASGTYVPVEEPENMDEVTEATWAKMNEIHPVEKVEAEPPRRFFNIFRRRRNG